MAVKKILTISKYEKFLKTPSEPVKKINKEVKQLIQDIKDTMADPSIPALGLAAPQIGVLKRVFGIYIGYYDHVEAEKGEGKPSEPEPLEATIFINPEILERSEDSDVDQEGCLSIPGMVGNVQRKLKVKVRYLNEQGQKVEREFVNDDARAFQHELDHLDGILFLQRLDSLNELFVNVPNKNGGHTLVPYPDVVRHASEQSQSNT